MWKEATTPKTSSICSTVLIELRFVTHRYTAIAAHSVARSIHKPVRSMFTVWRDLWALLDGKIFPDRRNKNDGNQLCVCFLVDAVRPQNANSAQFGHSWHYDRVGACDGKLQPGPIQRGRWKVDRWAGDVRLVAGNILYKLSLKAVYEIVLSKMNIYELLRLSFTSRVFGQSLAGPGVVCAYSTLLQLSKSTLRVR